jgi:hypothetical protein
MMRLLLGLLAILGATFFYYIGETDNIFKIKPNKWYKTMMGIPPATFLALLWSHSWFLALLTVASYFVALQFGYGEHNILTKWLGKKGSLIFCGCAMGLASFPILGWFCILQAIISGAMFYWLDTKNGIINEPWVAILRGIGGSMLLI